jgi:GNAT superfamily N-acetyltransferase
MGDVLVRAVRPGDAADLARGWVEGARYYAEFDPDRFQVPSGEGLVEWIAEAIGRPRSDHQAWLVAQVGDAVVGEVRAEVRPPLDPADAARQLLRHLSEPRLFVSALWVEPAHQRRGVGTRLMEAVERWGRDRGATLATLDTWVGSPLSVPFYERRMGYRRASIVFEKRLDTERGVSSGSGELQQGERLS